MLDAAKAERTQALEMPILPFLNSAVWQQISTWAVEQRVVKRCSLLSRGDALLAIGSNLPALLRLHVQQIDRVLRGARPAETPFVQPTLWDALINQKLARAAGVLLQAKEVIEWEAEQAGRRAQQSARGMPWAAALDAKRWS